MMISRSLFLLIGLFLLCGPSMAQQCDAKVKATTPTSQFKDAGNGTVTDTKTGLMWMRCPLGMHWKGGECADVAASYEWKDARQELARLNRQGGYAGHADWRMPSREELQSLVENRCYDPVVNTEIFPATPATGFWSETPDADYAQGAWLVYFRHGSSYMGNREQAWLLRPVRGDGH